MMGFMVTEKIAATGAPRRHAGPAEESGTPPSRAVWRRRLLVAGVVLAALNLRPAITSLGALLEEVRDGLGMSGGVAGVLTSVPSVCFAVFGLLAPRLARRIGLGAVLLAAMAAVAVGLLVRPWLGSTAGLLAGTALALMGIAVTNVLMPVVVKRWFPDRMGPMTGLYSMALALGTALAAATAVPLTGLLGGDWRTGLAVWGLLGVVAVVPWLFFARRRDDPAEPAAPRGRHARVSAPGRIPAPREADARDARPDSGEATRRAPGETAGERPALRLVRSPIAWSLGVFFGLQATGAYISMGWMAQIYRDAGVAASTAGVLLAVAMVMGVPLAFVIPNVAARLRHQGPAVVVLGLSGLAGYVGLYAAPAAGAWVWAVLIGISNCAFPLALTMVGMRARTGAGVAQLSAFAQSVGYLVSIPGPFLVGVLYQHSGGWGLPIALVIGLLIPQMVMGVLAGRDRTIEDEAAARERRVGEATLAQG